MFRIVRFRIAFHQLLLVFLALAAITVPSFGLTGNALSFDGNGDVVTVPHHADFLLGNTFTVEAWVRPDAQSVALVNRWSPETPTSSHWIFEIYNGKLWLFYAGSWFQDAGAAVPLGRWSHVAVTVSPTEISFYVNGAFQSTRSPSATLTNDAIDLRIGFAIDNSLLGRLRDVRIWSSVRTADEIAAHLQTPVRPFDPNLVAEYRFEGIGQTVRDSGPGGRHGVLGTTSGDEASDPVRESFFGFDRSAGEGWSQTSSIERAWDLQPVPPNWGGASSGTHVMLATPHGSRDRSHGRIVLHSPPFQLGPGSDLVIDLWGGEGQGFDPAPSGPANEDALASATDVNDGQHVMGVALRRVSDGAYVLFRQRSVEGNSQKEEIRMDADALAPYADGESLYAIDVFDTYEGNWGWISIDSVSIPAPDGIAHGGVSNLVSNGSFETPVVDVFEQFPAITGWAVAAGSFELQDAAVTTPADGDQYLELASNEASSIWQNLRTQPGMHYLVEIDFAPRPGILGNHLQVFWNGAMVGEVVASGSGDTEPQWRTLSYSVSAFDYLSRLELTDPRTGVVTNGTLVDNVRVTPAVIFSDGFESGSVAAWSSASP